MPSLLIQGCDILRVESGLAVIDLRQDILIDGTRIRAVGLSGTLPVDPEAQIIHAANMLAIPGLMNTHAHVPMVLFRGMVEDVTVNAWFNDYIWPLESNLTPEDVYWGALLGMAEMIENGVTCVADHYFAMDEVAQAAEGSGMRANLAWAVFGHEGPEKLERTCRFVQDWQGKADGRITAYLGPHAPYTTNPEFLKLSAQRARDLNTGIHIHVSESEAQLKLSLEQYGISPVRQLEETGVFEVPTILAHCRYPTTEDLDLLAGKNTGIAHAPKTYLKLGTCFVSLQPYLQRGIPIGLATDGAASSNTLDILEQLRMMVIWQKSGDHDPTLMTVPQTLEIAFQGSARVLHQPYDLGAIRPGMLADLALIRQDGISVSPRFNPPANLIYSTHSHDVDTVICNGKLLLRGGSLLTIDKNEVKRQVASRLERLSERVPGRRIAVYPT